MKALRWTALQSGVMFLSWALAFLWLSALLTLFDVQSTMIWIAGIVAAAVLPFLSFVESLIMLVIRRKNRMGLLDSLFTGSVLVVGPFLGGYFYLIGECLECEPVVATFVFAILVFAIPTALVQSTLRKMFIKI
jgi:hypothetical protein